MLTTLIVAIIIVVLILAVWVARRQRRQSRRAMGADSAAGGLNKQVYVGNLPYQITDQELHNYFGAYGVIEQVKIVRNHGSGRSKGFGFVTYRSAADAQKALAAHGQKYEGRTIVVRIAKPR